MENIKVIAHRGGRGMGTENTLAALRHGLDSGADALELDVQVTKDRQLVMCHDRSSPRKIYGIERPIPELTLAELKKYKSKSGDTIPKLDEIAQLGANKPLVIDLKTPDSGGLVADALKKIDHNHQWIISSNYPNVLKQLKKRDPDAVMTLHTYTRPLKAIREAKEIGASYVTFTLYLLNPLSYFLARRSGLGVLVYQNYASFVLNWPWLVRLLWFLYPGVAVFTDRPDKIVPALKD